MNSLRIKTIGAGVIGLTTANLLLKKGHLVKIIAREFPNDTNPHYTSPLFVSRFFKFFYLLNN